MTNEELFTDLKQFIEATVSQQTAHLDERIDTVEKHMDGVERRISSIETTMATKEDVGLLDQKLDHIQDAIADTLTHNIDATDITLQDHEQRLRRLEHKAA